MFVRVLTIAVVLALTGCEKASHENLDKWLKTESGPGKIKKAFLDPDVDPDISAHAAANLVKLQDGSFREGFETMGQARRTQVIEKLAPKLWEMARVNDENQIPNGLQIAGKDALVTIRRWADDTTRQKVDGYLVDWYGVISYEGRADRGAYIGCVVMRMVGPPGGKKLMGVVNALIAQPGQEKKKFRIGDELMLGMAASGSPEAVKYLLDLARLDRGDPTLGKRATDQLYKAYVDPGGLFDVQTNAPLVPNVDAIVGLAKDDAQPGNVVDNALALLERVGPPKCLPPLLEMIPQPHKKQFKFAVAGAALRCGGPKAVTQVVLALPDGGAYWREELTGAISGEIAKMSPRSEVLAGLRQLLDAKSTVAKWVAIEALAAMKSKDDVPRIAALAKSKERLVGYWGEDSGGKADPTLGEQAKALASQLENGTTKPPK